MVRIHPEDIGSELSSRTLIVADYSGLKEEPFNGISSVSQLF